MTEQQAPSTRRTDELVIFVGDYLPRIRQLETRAKDLEEVIDQIDKARAKARTAGSDSPSGLTLDEDDNRDELAVEHAEVVAERDRLYAEGQQSAWYVGIQAPKRSWWKKTIAEHPMRRGEEFDALAPDLQALEEFVGFNIDTFPEVLVPAGLTYVRKGQDAQSRPWSQFGTEEQDEFLDDVGEGDFSRLWQAIAQLYRGWGVDPKPLPLALTTSPQRSSTSD